MSINFPKNPSTDDTYTYLTTSWKYNGVAWEKSAATETGNTEGTTGGIAYYEGKNSTIKGSLNAFYDETNERVGIGTSGPTELLDVRGGITASNIYIAGGATFGADVRANNLVLTEDGTISVEGDSEAITLNFGGGVLDISSTSVDFKQKIRHRGDPDTYINFTPNNIEMFANGDAHPAFLESDGDKTNIGGCTAGHSGFTADTLKVENELILGGNIILPDEGHIGGGDGQDRIVFDINGNHIDVNTNVVRINSKLEHLGDSNTHLDFDVQDSIKLTAGGNEFIHGTATKANIGGCTSGHGGFTANNMKVENELILGGNIIMPEDGEIQIGGDSEHIVFNGSSAQIEMQANEVFFNHRLQHYGDSDTGIQFDTNTVNIHAGDIGVNKISVTASGVDMASGCNFSDSTVSRPKLIDYSETVNAIGTVTGNTAVDFENGNVQTIEINGACELSFSNPPASGTSGTVTLIITNGGSASVTYAAGDGLSLSGQLVKWPSNAEPSLTSSGIDIITFLTTDGGSTVYGFVGGLNFL